MYRFSFSSLLLALSLLLSLASIQAQTYLLDFNTTDPGTLPGDTSNWNQCAAPSNVMGLIADSSGSYASGISVSQTGMRDSSYSGTTVFNPLNGGPSWATDSGTGAAGDHFFTHSSSKSSFTLTFAGFSEGDVVSLDLWASRDANNASTVNAYYSYRINGEAWIGFTVLEANGSAAIADNWNTNTTRTQVFGAEIDGYNQGRYMNINSLIMAEGDTLEIRGEDPSSNQFTVLNAARLTVLPGTPSVEPQHRILFVGNSFTAGHNGGGKKFIPNFFKALALSAGHPAPFVEVSFAGGRTFKNHYRAEGVETPTKIAERDDWTHVVIQNHSKGATRTGSIADHMAYGALLYDLIITNNPSTQVVLYQTWSYKESHSIISGTSTSTTFASTSEMLDEIKQNYAALADVINSKPENADNLPVYITPSGQAFYNAGANLPSSVPGFINLFISDGYHPNDAGYYLSACTHYATIYNESPEGLHAQQPMRDLVASLNINLPDSIAAYLEAVAWQTVLDEALADSTDYDIDVAMLNLVSQ